MVTPSEAIAALRALENPVKAAEMTAYHKGIRPFLGVSNPQIDGLVKIWRKDASPDQRVAIATHLWASNFHETRVGAAKLLVQKRLTQDAAVWAEICRWAPDFDAWAIADHACQAGSLRLVADPSRLDTVESWTTHDNMWVRRAALVICLPWARLKMPEADEVAVCERILGWAASYVPDHEWFIQKSIGWWLRELSKRDPERVLVFLATHGDGMKPFARKEALKYLK